MFTIYTKTKCVVKVVVALVNQMSAISFTATLVLGLVGFFCLVGTFQ